MSNKESDKEGDKEFDFAVWCSRTALSDAGAKKLMANLIIDELSISLLDDATLATVKLLPGDLVKFKRGRTLMQESLGLPELEVDTGFLPKPGDKTSDAEKGAVKGALKPSEAGVYTLDQFAQFLAGNAPVKDKGKGVSPVVKTKATKIGELPCPSGNKGYENSEEVESVTKQKKRRKPRKVEKDNSSETSSSDESDDGGVSYGKHLLKDLLNVDDCFSNSKGERPLLPVNCLRNPKGTITDHEDQVVSQNGKLIVKPNVKKPSPDQLTAGQWVAANAIILSKLIPKFTHQQLCDYLDYERRIGGLMQLFTHASVFILDHEHRIDRHKVGGKWNKIDPTAIGSLLKRKDESMLPAGMSTSRYGTSGNSVAGSSPSGGASAGASQRRQPFKSKGLCWAYNSAEGCYYGSNCRYTHAEPQKGGGRQQGSVEMAPRFQNPAQSTNQKP
jgi:hypothetical protein